MSKRNATESLVSNAGEYYASRQMGYIEKHDPPSRVMRNHRTQELMVRYLKRGYLDFTGQWRGKRETPGYGFVLEAKEVTSSDTFRAPKSGKILKREQMQAALNYADSGGLSFLLINFNVTTKTITKNKKKMKVPLSPDEMLQEAYLWRVDTKIENDPFIEWHRQFSNLNLSIGWFREHAVFVDRGDGGLAWGRGVEEYLKRIGL